MKIKQITEKRIILILPSKIRYLGLSLIIFGILIFILLSIFNNYQISFVPDSKLRFIISNLSLWTVLGLIFICEIPSIIYFFIIRNNYTGFGHVLLLVINFLVYIGSYSSIFMFSPILVTGIYFITHFKSVNIDSDFTFRERILLLFATRKTIPLQEIREIILKYHNEFKILGTPETPHTYRLKLFLLEKDPGFEDVPIADADEKDSLNFFRPHTLRKKLFSKPVLIDSSFFNYKNHEMVKFNRLIEALLTITKFSRVEEISKNNEITIRFSK